MLPILLPLMQSAAKKEAAKKATADKADVVKAAADKVVADKDATEKAAAKEAVTSHKAAYKNDDDSDATAVVPPPVEAPTEGMSVKDRMARLKVCVCLRPSLAAALFFS